MYEKNPEEKKFELMKYIKMEGLNCCSCVDVKKVLTISLGVCSMCHQKFYERNGISIPITDEMYKIFYQGLDNSQTM